MNCMPILDYLAPEPRYKADADDSQFGEAEVEEDNGIQILTELREAERTLTKMGIYVSNLQDAVISETSGTNLHKSMLDYSATGASVPAGIREMSIGRELKYLTSKKAWQRMKTVLAIEQPKGEPPVEVAVYRGDCKHVCCL